MASYNGIHHKINLNIMCFYSLPPPPQQFDTFSALKCTCLLHKVGMPPQIKSILHIARSLSNQTGGVSKTRWLQEKSWQPPWQPFGAVRAHALGL